MQAIELNRPYLNAGLVGAVYLNRPHFAAT
jgi:hypothetical protein